MGDIRTSTVKQLVERIRKRELTCVQVATEFLDAIESNKHLNAVIYCNRDQVLQEAAQMDKEADAGQFRGPLHGVPIGIKDNIHIKGIPNTAGCPALIDFIPSEDAPIIKTLREAGALFIAKLNMHELAFGATSDNKAFGRVGNARDPQYSAAGSSGGSGAAVAAHLVPAGLGTDTGGSVRMPSSVNGVCGLRPTMFRYSNEGITPIVYIRDTAGPIATNTDDLIYLDEIITGQKYENKVKSLKGVRFGVSNDFLCADLHPDVHEAFEYAKRVVVSEGAELVDIEFAPLSAIDSEYGWLVLFYGARVDVADYLKKYNVGLSLSELISKIASPDVKKFYEEKVMSSEYNQEMYDKALKVNRPQLQKAYHELFERCKLDAILSPTILRSAIKFDEIDEKTLDDFTRNMLTQTFAGIPSLSIPITGGPIDPHSMPIGLMIDGLENTDQYILNLAKLVEDVFQRNK